MSIFSQSWQKTITLILIFLMLSAVVFAQDRDPDVDDWDDYRTGLFSAGDQSFIISLGTIFPLAFRNTYTGEPSEMKFRINVGGAGSLSYIYFLTPNIFVGGEVHLHFISSVAGNSTFMVPLGARGGYQFNFWKIEIPVSAGIGMYWNWFLSKLYYGLYTRLGVSAYYRAIGDWSFGLGLNWFWYPQWTNDPKKNIDGHVLELTLSAKYNF